MNRNAFTIIRNGITKHHVDATKLGKSQQALLERRIAALKVALMLSENEQAQNEEGE